MEDFGVVGSVVVGVEDSGVVRGWNLEDLAEGLHVEGVEGSSVGFCECGRLHSIREYWNEDCFVHS